VLSHKAARQGQRNRNKVVSRYSKPTRGMQGPDARLIEDFIGRGGSGGSWAFRALDPCAEQLAGGERIPDRTTGETVAFECRGDRTIMPPTDLADSAEWDCLILSMPIPEAPIWIFTKKTSDANWPAQPSIFGDPAVNPGYVWNVHDPTWWKLRSTGPTLGNYSEAFRTTFKGFSVLHDAPDLYNQGRVFLGQYRSHAIKVDYTESALTGNDKGAVTSNLWFKKIPSDQSALLSACPGMVKMRAVHGAYIPSRFSNPVHTYTDTPWGYLRIDDTAVATRGLSAVTYEMTDGNGNNLGEHTLTGTDASAWTVVSGTDNTQVGVCLFTGMAKQATLDIKLRFGLEAQAAPASPWSLFTEETPYPDEAAITEMAIIQDKMDTGYPESYNSFGALIPVIGGIVAEIARWGIGKATAWFTKRYSKPATQPVDIPVD
jgi:hypothetical protein